MILIRYEDFQVPEHSRPQLARFEFPVIRETAGCYVIARQYRFNDPPGYQEARPEQFILKDRLGRRYAYASDADALNSYRVRKLHAINHAEQRVRKQKAYLAEVERRIAGDLPPDPEYPFGDFSQ